MSRRLPLTLQEARAIGDSALAFLAGEPQRLIRFLQATGMTPGELRSRMDADETLTAVLNHVLEDESLLLVFASEARVQPEQVAPAAALLGREAGATQ